MKYTIPIALLLLSGCVEAGAIALNDARALHESAAHYVRAVHDARREVRRECWEILMEEVAKLRVAGEYQKARDRLAANYPALVTIDVLSENQEETPSGTLPEPFGCN